MIFTFVCLQQGWNAVHMAAAGDYDDILELLFENGAEMDARDLVVSCCPYSNINIHIPFALPEN